MRALFFTAPASPSREWFPAESSSPVALSFSPSVVPVRCAMGAKAAVKKFDAADSLRLRRILNARCHRNRAGALALRKQVDSLKTPIGRYELMRAKIIVGSSGCAVKPKNEAFDPSRGLQIASLDLRKLETMCVVKSLPNNSLALQRTLAIYAHLRELNVEATAPLPALLRVVKNPKVSKPARSKRRAAKAKAKAASNDKGKGTGAGNKRLPKAAAGGVHRVLVRMSRSGC